MTVEPLALPMKEAVAFWEDKVPMPAARARELAEELRLRAFYVSGLSQMDQLLDVRNAIGKAIAKGTSYGEFRKTLAPLFEAKGWTGKKAWRVENIFRNNIQTAYGVGRYRQNKESGVENLQYDAVGDKRTRPTHAALDGLVFPIDHPFWDTWYPLNGHLCRCGAKGVSNSQAKRRGLKIETKDPTGKLIEPIDPVTGQKLPARLLMPDRGFDYHPGKAAYKADLTKYPADIKQGFLESMLKSFCPDDWPEFAESECFRRLKKNLTQDDLEDLETLVWARKKGGIEGFPEWVDRVLKSGRAKGEFMPVGNLPPKVVNHLQANGHNPRLSLVVIDDQGLLHMQRDVKNKAGKTLTHDEIKEIPDRFKTGDWYYDQTDPAALVCWQRYGDDWLKVVIRTDVKIGKTEGTANRVVTTGMVNKKDSIDNANVYKKI